MLVDNSFMSLMNIYCDESCKDAHRYLALGAVCVESAKEPTILQALMNVRKKYDQFGEVKWTKNRRQKVTFYKAFTDVFFDFATQDDLRFQGMYVDTSTFKHHIYNSGDRELGFSKLIYQLLLHKFGRCYGFSHPMHVYLDARVTKQEPAAMLPMLNSHLKQRWGCEKDPFKRITFQDSAKSDLIQLTDLLVGSVGATKNGHYLAPDAAEFKGELREHIIRRALACEPTRRLNRPSARRFGVWPFEFKKK